MYETHCIYKQQEQYLYNYEWERLTVYYQQFSN